MRTDLYRDPKVCVMADILIDPDGALARYVNQNCQCNMVVTRNVMRNVTVGALVAVWGVMRLRGKRYEDDLVCNGATVSVIDDIAEMPGFGDAMRQVGWVQDTESGIVFPRFFEDYNVDPEETAKKKNAERQQRLRDRRKQEAEERNVTSRDNNVTVTHREEKRREEKRHLSSVPSDDSFERFWAAWPSTDRKAAKAKCAEKWAKGGLPLIADTIIEHVEHSKLLNRQWSDGYEPAPLTYLNQRRWEDGADSDSESTHNLFPNAI